ncbi:MAG: hypothetical protein ACNS60_15800 [Candidatus Cyclobacteriaceae bacterium M2_1C_046]
MNSDTIIATIAAKGIDLAYHEIKKALGRSKEIAKEKALNEQADLLRILNKKIEKIDKVTQQIINRNLQEPDIYEALHKSLSGVYKYSDALKTQLTAELIWQRLTSTENNNVKNQIINESITKLEKLSVNQLNILAGAYILEFSEYNLEQGIAINLNSYKEWVNNDLQSRSFYERNILTILNFAEEFSHLDNIQITDDDIFFIKSEGLADLNSSVDQGLILSNSLKATLSEFPKINIKGFQAFILENVRDNIKDEYSIFLPETFFRLNLNSYGLHIGKETLKLLESKKKEIKKEREVKVKYNQAQYERYNAGLLGE